MTPHAMAAYRARSCASAPTRSPGPSAARKKSSSWKSAPPIRSSMPMASRSRSCRAWSHRPISSPGARPCSTTSCAPLSGSRTAPCATEAAQRIPRSAAGCPDQTQDILRCLGDIGTGAKDRLDSRLFQELVILLRNDTTADHENIPGITRLQLLDQARCQRLVPCRLAADAHHMHIVVDGILRGLFRGLKERTDIDIEPDIGEGGSDHLGTPVMTVLAHLDHKHARP